LLLLFIIEGCGLFTTREPETPTGMQTGDEIADTPQDVLTCMKTAISLHDPEMYLKIIDQKFDYAAPSYQENPVIFQTWGFDQENSFIHRLLSPTLLPAVSIATLTFEHISDTEWVDSLLTVERYTLEIEISITDFPTLYEGQAELKMIRQENGGWKISQWVDEAAGGKYSMSHLRATL